MEQTAEGTALSPFRHRDFTLYQSARVVLILAGQLVIVGLQLQVLQLTNSAFHLGMIGLAQVLPNLLASLPAGHIADRVNRRTIITTCALVNAATVGWLAWESAQPQPSLVAIYIACGLFGLIRAFSAPAGHAFLPALVPASLLNRAIVIHLTVFNLATVIGPAGGGFLYGERNALRVYATATVLFVVAYLLMVLIRTRPAPAPGAEPFERAFTAGVRYVWNDKRLLGAMSLDLFAVLMGGATALLSVGPE